MHIGTCIYKDQQYLFVERDATILIPAIDPRYDQPEYRDVLCFIRGGRKHWRQCAEQLSTLAPKIHVDYNAVTLLAPIPRPPKNVMCLGWNYREHVTETAAQHEVQVPKHPIVFTKAVTSVTGPHADVPFDASVSAQLDWEVELGVVIGEGGINISPQDARNHVFGYTVINDISARDLQFRHEQFFIGKSLNGSCPMGPWIVTADEISDPQDLDLQCWVNDDIKQNSNTRYQIFDIASVIATLSRGMTLEPGDIIATGTPSGVGFVRKPPEFLAPGDVVTCEVEGIGRIENKVVGLGDPLDR